MVKTGNRRRASIRLVVVVASLGALVPVLLAITLGGGGSASTPGHGTQRAGHVAASPTARPTPSPQREIAAYHCATTQAPQDISLPDETYLFSAPDTASFPAAEDEPTAVVQSWPDPKVLALLSCPGWWQPGYGCYDPSGCTGGNQYLLVTGWTTPNGLTPPDALRTGFVETYGIDGLPPYSMASTAQSRLHAVVAYGCREVTANPGMRVLDLRVGGAAPVWSLPTEDPGAKPLGYLLPNPKPDLTGVLDCPDGVQYAVARWAGIPGDSALVESGWIAGLPPWQAP